ncbi:hypothetical protein [uncultured Roseibium sp.]|uniref:hypothetical protein n=1 Tax=uncultured Roseibium sp. TaxID=1936171 RepID=UPI00262691C1|nr:hypothetical protein [uncultured Roseibium sp.]
MNNRVADVGPHFGLASGKHGKAIISRVLSMARVEADNYDSGLYHDQPRQPQPDL